ncbi:MFS transporter [Candidatus Heimdallarchaeota archaeon B3_Heim]|nr:MAG: MFS transporter [Candidatus Heimdallarchaeota archaeon B3_Heim]
MGYLTEKRTTRFSKRFGRRFPWIIGGSFIWVFTFILIFAIPDFVQNDQTLLFIWMILTTCLFDTFYSLWDVNYQSIFPDKFRSESVRSRAASIATVIGIFGIAIGFILPSELTTFGVPSSYVTMAIVVAVVGFFLVFLLIPGVKESPDMIDRFYKDRESSESSSFFGELARAFRVRNFLAWIIMYFFYQSAINSLVGSVQYIGDYVLPPDSSTTLMFVGLLVGAIFGIIIWLQFRKLLGDRITNQRLMMITALVMAFFALPMTLLEINSVSLFTIFLFLGGIGFGGYWMIMTPALADVIDEIVIKTGKRNDGIFMGFRSFFGRLAFAVQAISFWLIHELTDFNPVAGATQTETAIFGIHIHTALLPAIFLVIGVFVFWRMNTLTHTSVQENKERLKEMGL